MFCLQVYGPNRAYRPTDARQSDSQQPAAHNHFSRLLSWWPETADHCRTSVRGRSRAIKTWLAWERFHLSRIREHGCGHIMAIATTATVGVAGSTVLQPFTRSAGAQNHSYTTQVSIHLSISKTEQDQKTIAS